MLELAELCCPTDREVWLEELPEPEGGHTINARLGDAFFYLTAIVHGKLYRYEVKQLNKFVDRDEYKHRRRYQTVTLAKDKNNQEINLIQFAPSGEDDEHFRMLVNRINLHYS